MIEKLVALFNEAAALDPFAVRLLVQYRQSCNDKLGDRFIVNSDRGFRASIGLLGLLNGLDRDKQRVVAVIDADPMKPIRFEVGTPQTHPHLFK